MAHRRGEEDRPRFRSERFVRIDGQWYFDVRERLEPVGPFASRAEAEAALRFYLAALRGGATPAQALTQLRLARDPFAEDPGQ